MPQISVSSTVNRTNSSNIVYLVSSLCKASASPNNIDVVDSRFIRTVKHVPVSRQWPLSVETDAGLFAPAPVIKTQPEVTNAFLMPPKSTVGTNCLQPIPILFPDLIDEVLGADTTSYSNDIRPLDKRMLLDETPHCQSFQGPATLKRQSHFNKCYELVYGMFQFSHFRYHS
ncbi:hypothetical protein ElyMa_000178300 [Elysia marginata]|uniref:Uncharacterized protein n=1 Tax=Elysia marginata TaxID=1093978 RepID=A0AAV4ETT0_9GAST|nr:hypothetical protein ElyMa_000178300 [Elysia marginata]